MRERFEMSEIPLQVLVDEYHKWLGVIRDGWDDSLWSKSSLCEFIEDHVWSIRDRCDTCPFQVLKFCGCKSSKLYRYNYKNEEDWKQAVEEFLKFLIHEINKK